MADPRGKGAGSPVVTPPGIGAPGSGGVKTVMTNEFSAFVFSNFGLVATIPWYIVYILPTGFG